MVQVADIQWLHFASVRAGKSLESAQQTLNGKLGVLGKRLPDALADLFMSDDPDEIFGLELVAFDADDEYAWINPELFYFVAADEIKAEHRFPALCAWKALVGAVVMQSSEEAGSWLSLAPGRKTFKKLMNSSAFKAEPSDTLFKALELLVREVPELDAAEVPKEEVERLRGACQEDDTEAARKLEAVAWQLGDVNLWRYAMAIADGKSYLARMFEDQIES
jgi:hypothetical protein